MRALIVIDFANDFVDGNLPVGQPAVDIAPTVALITQQFIDNGDWVVMAVDLHEADDPYHPEMNLFPPHNIRGSQGRELYGPLEQVYNNNRDSIYWMDKTRYSAFCGTNLDLKLRERSITELHLIGVCTDICVLHTAIEAYNKAYQITIYEDAVASFNSDGHTWALQHFTGSLGAQVITSQG